MQLASCVRAFIVRNTVGKELDIENPVTYSPGDVQAVICMLLPDAFYRLTGISPAGRVNKVTPVNAVLNERWVDFSNTVLMADDEDQAIDIIESFLIPLWANVRSSKSPHVHRYEDWLNALALQVAVIF